jgi:hypothetical protein
MIEYNLLSSEADNKISELNKQYKEEIKQGDLINISKFPWGGNWERDNHTT